MIENKAKNKQKALTIQAELNKLLNEQRLAEADILRLKTNIRILTDNISKEDTILASEQPLIHDTDEKIRQIDNDILTLRREYETAVRAKEAEKKRISGDSRILDLTVRQKKSQELSDQSKLKRIELELRDKETKKNKLDISIRDLKLKLAAIKQ